MTEDFIRFDDIQQAKHDLIALGLPTELAIDFGPSFRPESLERAARNGADDTLGIDQQVEAEQRVLDGAVAAWGVKCL